MKNDWIQNFMLFSQTIVLILIAWFAITRINDSNNQLTKVTNQCNDQLIEQNKQFNNNIQEAQKNYNILLDDYLKIWKEKNK